MKLLTDSFINENEKEEVDDLNCGVCGELFCDPIKTRCNHSFCEKCALKELNDVCKCGEKTSGIFLYDKELSGKVKIEKQRLAQLAESEDAN